MKMNPFYAGLLTLAVAACQPTSVPVFQGYVEADYRYLAATGGGVLTDLHVTRGQAVKQNDVLFAIDAVQEQQELRRADAQIAQQQALLANLHVGQRPQERAVLRAQLAQAQAQTQQSEASWRRATALREQQLISLEQFDTAQLNHQRDIARVNELQARLKVAELGARRDEIDAARSQLQALMAVREQASWRLQQKQIRSPADGVIQDVLFQPGEVVTAARPVIVLLPDGATKVRFFVPEKALHTLRVNEKIHVQCDGCEKTIRATIRFISTQIEYTPPVLFNRDNRNELMFRVEAYPDDNALMRVGQPVEIERQP